MSKQEHVHEMPFYLKIKDSLQVISIRYSANLMICRIWIKIYSSALSEGQAF